jgi:hypothetical protein
MLDEMFIYDVLRLFHKNGEQVIAEANSAATL